MQVTGFNNNRKYKAERAAITNHYYKCLTAKKWLADNMDYNIPMLSAPLCVSVCLLILHV